MAIRERINGIKAVFPPHVKLVVVSKTQSESKILEAYAAGHKVFGENKVQELLEKENHLPKDIEWHFIGHLQSNKVKFIAPFVALIHSVDSLKLLKEINKQAFKNNRIINCLLQIHIAEEETKFGLSPAEAKELLSSESLEALENIKITGLMGMATNTTNEALIAKEFQSLKTFFDASQEIKKPNARLSVLSMGMSSDYEIAIKNGSTLVRIGSSIFGNRN